jgi:MHS family proline/betaine transporter-like MFS transporter
MSVSTGHSSPSRVVFAGAVGNAIEFYDFTVYAFLASYFAVHFFPSSDPVAGLLASYGVLAVGMLMRPVGAVLFGIIGDRISRRMALQLSVVMIAVPTLIIGLLPTYQAIGVAAPITLVALRMIQGLSVGGEYSASIVYIVEHAPRSRRGLWGSFSPMGAFGGLFLGTAVCIAVVHVLGTEAMAAWGWRIPFIASVALTAAGVAVRMRLKADQQHTPIASGENVLTAAFFRHWWEMSAIALANISTGIVTFVAFAFAVAWMVDVAGVTRQHALAINLYGLVAVGALSLLGGAAGDRLGKLRVSMAGLATLLLGAWPAFAAMGSQSTLMQIAGISIIALGQGFFVGPLCACMVALVPAGVRTTVVSIGYSASVGVFGGLAPLVTEYLFARLGLHMAPALVIMAGALVSLTAIILLGRWPYHDPVPPEEREGSPVR